MIDEGSPNPPGRSWTESCLSCGVSLTVHGVILLVMSWCIISSHEASPAPEELLVLLDDEDPPERGDDIKISFESLPDRISKAVAKDSSLKAMVPAVANASPQPQRVKLNPLLLATYFPQHAADGTGVGGAAIRGSAAEDTGTGSQVGRSNGEEGEGTVGFFGTRAAGNSFVFIVDCSGSMSTPVKLRRRSRVTAGTRYDRAIRELANAMKELSAEQSFYVVFFNHETYPLFHPNPVRQLLKSAPSTRERTYAWTRQISPSGETAPQDAMKLALSLKPDVIFFLTDGVIPGVTRRIAKGSNKSDTVIHTIAFGLRGEHGLMKGIAKDNGGRFRFVE